MRVTRVAVTNDHISYGRESDKGNCMVVVGMKYADEDLERIQVDEEYIVVSSRVDQVRRWFKTPPNVARQIRQFDRDRSKVKPFTFTLDPEQAVKVKPVAQQSAEVLARRAARPRSTGTGKPLAHRPQAA